MQNTVFFPRITSQPDAFPALEVCIYCLRHLRTVPSSTSTFEPIPSSSRTLITDKYPGARKVQARLPLHSPHLPAQVLPSRRHWVRQRSSSGRSRTGPCPAHRLRDTGLPVPHVQIYSGFEEPPRQEPPAGYPQDKD